MIRLQPFEIHRPATLAEASEALATLGETATAYAGGTELLLAMKLAGLRYEHLVDVKTIPDTAGIAEQEGLLRLSAATTHRAVERSELVRRRVPVLGETAARIANPRVRATGTIGGNLCFAEPHSDLATLLLCLGARCVVGDGSRERELTIDELVIGPYETALGPGELLLAVLVPVDGPGTRSAYGKFQVHERPGLGLAVRLELSQDEREIREARVAVGCVSPTPRRSERAEALLTGPIDRVRAQVPAAADALADTAEMVDDEEGSEEYKRHLVGVYLRRQLDRALAGRP